MVRDMKGKRPQYFEATLQLRNPNQEVVSFVEQEINSHKIYVAKVIEIKTGLDYQLADNSFTLALGRKLQQKFGGQLLLTSSLFSQKDGKDIHRGTVLFRRPNFSKGDIVIYDGEEFKVKSMGKDILLYGITKPRKVHVRYSYQKQIKKKE
jgi:NMD protein affecting ribosome stability and mRNA decay